MTRLFSSRIRSLVLFLKMKNLLDRILPIATMYLQFVDGQMRHVPRYDVRPNMGLIYVGEGDREYLEF